MQLSRPFLEFSLHSYLRGLEAEFAALGIDVNVKQQTTTPILELAIDDNNVLKMKVEMDTDPPLGFRTEELLLDLGAREAVANHCLLLPVSIAQQPWLHLGTTLGYAVLHGWLRWRLVAFVRRLAPSHLSTVQLLFPLAMLQPTLYGAAHMRYLIPIIPVLLLFGFKPKPIGIASCFVNL